MSLPEVPQTSGLDDAQGFWARVLRQFKRNYLAVMGLYSVLALVVMALSADFLANDKPLYMEYKGQRYFPVPYSYLVDLGVAHWPLELLNVDYRSLPAERVIFPPIPYRPNRVDLTNPFAPPSAEHWLGTDRLGRDVMAGIVHGARISLSIGFVATGIAVVIGVFLGALAGFFGGWVDLAISRLFELMMAIPTFLLLITVAAFLKPSIYYTMVIIGLTGWVGMARFTRNEFLKVRGLDYVTAATALGLPDRRIMFLHILPNALAPVLVSVVLSIAAAILTESGLSFLGVGVPADTVTWGSILNEARSNTFAWWLGVFPTAAIFVAVIAYYLVGEGLRDALDPRLK
jgi:peptide/nickel transport system permease protein